jgi:hypothetical protein
MDIPLCPVSFVPGCRSSGYSGSYTHPAQGAAGYRQIPAPIIF